MKAVCVCLESLCYGNTWKVARSDEYKHAPKHTQYPKRSKDRVRAVCAQLLGQLS